jgi:peptide/nickel transport system permease protein/oligopeptide transport system permease protein
MAPRSPSQRAWARFRKNRWAVGSTVLLLVVIAVALAWPLVLTVAGSCGPDAAAFAQRYQSHHLSDAQFQAPGPGHWFGTDVHGRELFSRVLSGARISLMVGVVGAGISLVLGVLWGAVAGYAGGKTDSLMMRTVDVLYALPSIIFVIVLITVVEDGWRNWLTSLGVHLGQWSRLVLLCAGLGAVSWLDMARIVRGQVVSLRHRPFVEASRVLGASPGRVLARHIIPHTLGVALVYLTLTVPTVVLYESFLSYLGLGIQPPMASLGSLMAEGAEQINPIRTYWWLIVFPGATLVLCLVALNFLGDGLRDAWDVRSREEGA